MIHLINLPQLNSKDDKLDPPLGLLYIAGMLEERGIQVKVIDLSFLPSCKWEQAIGYAETYGITVFSASLHLAKQVRDICKKINPKCTVVVGGPHPTALPNETAKSFDCCVTREGEYSLLESIQGIVDMPTIEDLNKLPLPARHLVDLHAYHRKISGRQATTMVTSRGCPYPCAFCCKDVFGSRVRNFSTDYVINEVKTLIRDFAIKAFIFYDDTFTLNKKRLKILCDEFKKLDIYFRCNGDTRRDTLEDFQMLHDAGCKEVCFGIESGSQTVLDKINKRMTVAKNTAAIKNAQKAGLIAKAFLMIGNPGETRETVEETKQWIIDADPDQYSLFNFVPFPGCDIWKHPDKYDITIVNKDFDNYFSLAGENEGGLVVNTKELKAIEIGRLREEMLEFLKYKKQRGVLQDYYAKS